jgi:TetR/AcrR family transcriptional regulator, ethionamide resistance regulator
MEASSAMGRLRAARRAERELELVRPDTRTAILDATERLLAEIPLHDLTVAQVMKEAEVSRGTFYSYFSSKFEAAAALLERTMAEAFEVMRGAIDEVDRPPKPDALRAYLEGSTRLWQEHRAVLRASHENWHAVPELRERWLAAVERFTDALVEALRPASGQSERDLRRRVAAALWATERLEYIADSEVDDDVGDGDELIDTLMELWAPLLQAS